MSVQIARTKIVTTELRSGPSNEAHPELSLKEMTSGRIVFWTWSTDF
jgi:hypothetical protein